MLIGGGSQGMAQEGETMDKLRDRKLELADEDPAVRRDGKAQAVDTSRKCQGEIGNQQRLTHFGLSADKQDTLQWEQSRFDQAGRRRRWLLLEQLGQRQHRRWGGLGGCRRAHHSPSPVASSRIASPPLSPFPE